MTNYERLLDLPLREVLKEFDRQYAAKEALFDCFAFNLMVCDGTALPCKICDDVVGSCGSVCRAWFDAESASDANYNDDVWHDAAKENPPTSDVTIEYIVLIDGAELPTILTFDGDSWRDDSGAYYCVALWRPMPKLPETLYE